MTPNQTSEHIAALSLSEDGKDPYVSIFYTVERGAISFTALLVAGVEAFGESQRLVYFNGSEGNDANPDAIYHPLVVGMLYRNGQMNFTHGVDIMLRSEQEAISLICVMRALYQMQGELKGAKV